MRTWNFDPTQYEARDFALIPEGDHRVTITDVTEKQYSTGNEGLQITFEVSGYTSNLWYHLILDPNDIQKTNQRIGMFFDSFGITNYNLSCYEDWVGKSGAVRVKHSAYNGKINATVPFCLSRSQQAKFPDFNSSNTNHQCKVSNNGVSSNKQQNRFDGFNNQPFTVEEFSRIF